ncbi:hypothetical protein KQ876_01335 [Mycoplasma sp. CSL7491-lung]|uniref:hypothetical protein n=1 Tax=Mycoplasma sp. CSL7491-lung TaxID=549718 RepID=UPI001C126496|nr:hypothetical protein [Mycoplasma sp. CSL7491-lung]MBU4692848.1 hypothetical protein [Mycoplasma sp. CSL7491-lung]
MNKKIRKIIITGTLLSSFTLTSISCSNNYQIPKKEDNFENIIVNISYKNSLDVSFDNLSDSDINNNENYYILAPNKYLVQLISKEKKENEILVKYNLVYKNKISKTFTTSIPKEGFFTNKELNTKETELAPNFEELRKKINFQYQAKTSSATQIDTSQISHNQLNNFNIKIVDVYNFDNSISVNYIIYNNNYSSKLFTYNIKKIVNNNSVEEDNQSTEYNFELENNKISIEFTNKNFIDFNSIPENEINNPENYNFSGTTLEHQFISASKQEDNKILVKYKLIHNGEISNNTFQSQTINSYDGINFMLLNKAKINYKNSNNTLFKDVETSEKNKVSNDKIEFVNKNSKVQFILIDAIKEENKIKVLYKIKYNNKYSQIFEYHINKYEFKLNEDEINEIKNGIEVSFNNPGSYSWDEIKQNIDNEELKNSFAAKEISIEYSNNIYIPEFNSITYDENNIIITLAFNNNQIKHSFDKKINKNIFVKTPASPEEAKVIVQNITTFSSAVRFEDIFNENMTIEIKSNDENAINSGINPGVYKIQVPKDQMKNVYSKNDENSIVKNGIKEQIIYADLSGLYNTEKIKNIRYELHINFNNRNNSENLLSYSPSTYKFKNNEFTILSDQSNGKSGYINIFDYASRNRWDNWDVHNTDQSNQKNYITFKTANNNPKTFYSFEFSTWAGSTKLDSKIVMPKNIVIKYSDDGTNWKEAKYQSKKSYKDFGPYRLFTSSETGNHGPQQYYETYNINRDSYTKGYPLMNFDFQPFRAKYVRFEWEPQNNLSPDINNKIQQAMFSLRLLSFRYANNDIKNYDTQTTTQYVNDIKINLINKIDEVNKYVYTLKRETNGDLIDKIFIEIEKARKVFYSEYNEELFNNKIKELNDLMN